MKDDRLKNNGIAHFEEKIDFLIESVKTICTSGHSKNSNYFHDYNFFVDSLTRTGYELKKYPGLFSHM